MVKKHPGADSGSPVTSRPAPTGPYLTASAAYLAGFRGWPLVVMTAIAGRESRWTPSESEVDSNGIYSTGLWQINSDQDVSQLKDPIYNAHTAFGMVGGNSLTGLSAWALNPSPASGQIPTPDASGYSEGGTFHPLNYTIVPWIPQARAAASEVTKYGPADEAEIRSTSGWAAAGSAVGGTGSAASSGATGSANQCNSGKVFSLLGVGPTGCNLKAWGGGACLFLGGALVLGGVALIVVSGLGGSGAASGLVKAANPIAKGASRVGRGRGTSSPKPAGPAPVGGKALAAAKATGRKPRSVTYKANGDMVDQDGTVIDSDGNPF